MIHLLPAATRQKLLVLENRRVFKHLISTGITIYLYEYKGFEAIRLVRTLFFPKGSETSAQDVIDLWIEKGEINETLIMASK